MRLLRLLFTGIALWLIWVLFRRWWRSQKILPQTPSATPPVHTVQCAYCGVYLPQGEATREGERWYCSGQHRRAAARGRS